MSYGGLCDWSLHTRPLEHGYCTSFGVLLKFKKPKVSAVRDFPPGCGPNELLNNLMSQDTKGEASLMDEENPMADENTVNDSMYDCLKVSEAGNGPLYHQSVNSSVKSELPDLFDLKVELVAAAEKVKGVQASSLAHNVPEDSKWLHEVEVQAAVKIERAAERDIVSESSPMVDGLITPGASKAWSPSQWPISDATILKETALKNKNNGRRVSADRDFPPFCGRNAPRATKEERMLVILGNRNLGASVEASVKGELSRERVRAKEEGCSVRETAWSRIDERDVGVQDGNALKKVLKGPVPEPKNKS